MWYTKQIKPIAISRLNSIKDLCYIDPTAARRASSGRGLAGFEEFTTAVTSAVTNVTNLFQTSVENRDRQLTKKRARNEVVSSNKKVKREEAIEMIRLLQDQVKIVEADHDVERKTKRLKSIHSALDREFDNLA